MPTTRIHPPAKPPAAFSADSLWAIPQPLPDAADRLRSLAQAIEADLEVLSYPSRHWDYSRDAATLEVAIVGAGYSGKSVAFGLMRHGIRRICIFDRCPAGQEGPWRTYARNATLRTPKEVTGGLDWGIPNLNFRRWCAARYGDDYWQGIRYIPRLLWAEYLDWYSTTLDLPLQHETAIQNIVWQEAAQCFLLQGQRQGQSVEYRARFVVLATGMESAGGRRVPTMVQQNLPDHCYHHTMDDIDFARFADKRIVVVGGGASAFDNALC
ncbi:MAG TPA: FAD/NAD(P)-binding protein, partial [Candidatus Obscuribacterales bacterium]